MELSVNVDHIATLREARKERFPSPVHAAVEVELGGADGVTVHLRSDQRHIQGRDVEILRQVIQTELTLEMTATDDMAAFAVKVRPDHITLVPETAGEVTTQSGLHVGTQTDTLGPFIEHLQTNNIHVGIFIDPDIKQVKQAARVGAHYIEINTNEYSQLHRSKLKDERQRIAEIAIAAQKEGMEVHAGHGLNYQNIVPLLSISEITGYSIGFAIVARAVFVGLHQATQEMVRIIKGER
jgi:pyridoxine 5-phosphate synthase